MAVGYFCVGMGKKEGVSEIMCQGCPKSLLQTGAITKHKYIHLQF